MLRLLFAPAILLVLLLETIDDPGMDPKKTYSFPTKREVRLVTLEMKLRRLNPWTRTGKRAKRIAEELLRIAEKRPPNTAATETRDSIAEWLNS